MASQSRFSWKVAGGIALAIFALVIALPDSWKTWAPGFLRPEQRLGLDLAGGTQLDFRISEDEIAERKAQLRSEIDTLQEQGQAEAVRAKQVELQSIEGQHTNLVEAIRTVLERRINSLGVSEATITPSYFGAEKHLLVECPGVVDVSRCIETVGKTIRLEFKEEQTGDDAGFEKAMRSRADQVYKAVTTGTGGLQIYGQDLSDQLGVSYTDTQPLFISSLPPGLEGLGTRTSKDPVFRAETTLNTTAMDENGQPVLREIKGIVLAKILEDKKPVPRALQDPKEAYDELAKTNPGAVRESRSAVALSAAPKEIQTPLQTVAIGSQHVESLLTGEQAIVFVAGRVEGKEEMTASHILIQYEGADRAEASVTRTKVAAKSLSDSILQRLKGGESFETIARTESDGPSKAAAGSLGAISRGEMVPPFEAAAFVLKQGELSGVVETPFGFHIIRADKAVAVSEPTVSYELLKLKTDRANAEKLVEQVEKGEITREDMQIVARTIFFSLEPTGWKDTELNGQRFRSASVTVDNVGVPVVQIQFDEEGGKIFHELTKRNIGKQIAIFVGGELVSAPVVQTEIAGGTAIITGSQSFEEAQALATDLNTGAIPAPIYLSGQTTIEATLGASALKQSIIASAVGLAVLCFFLILIYRAFGVVASIALLFYVVLLIAATRLPLLLITGEHIVLTLAGIAGMILSMGMAVDANVLAFERVKEELRKGKALLPAIDTGFKRAWPSVRDGNVSTLITSAILFIIGTSIIRGFAATLVSGIFISLFTAIVVSRYLSKKLALSALGKRPELFGVKKEKVETPNVILE